MYCLLSGHQNLAAHVAAFLGRGQLVFKVHARGTRFDHGFHQFKRVKHAAETRFSVGDNRRKPVDIILAFGVMQLISAHEGIVDSLYHRGHAVHGIEGLIGIHLACKVAIRCYLPAR